MADEYFNRFAATDPGDRIGKALMGFGLTIMNLAQAKQALDFQREKEARDFEIAKRSADIRAEAAESRAAAEQAKLELRQTQIAQQNQAVFSKIQSSLRTKGLDVQMDDTGALSYKALGEGDLTVEQQADVGKTRAETGRAEQQGAAAMITAEARQRQVAVSEQAERRREQESAAKVAYYKTTGAIGITRQRLALERETNAIQMRAQMGGAFAGPDVAEQLEYLKQMRRDLDKAAGDNVKKGWDILPKTTTPKELAEVAADILATRGEAAVHEWFATQCEANGVKNVVRAPDAMLQQAKQLAATRGR